MKLMHDLKQYSNGSKLKGLGTLLFNPNFHCVLFYRVANTLGKFKILTPLSKVIMYFNRIVYSIDIDYRAELAGGFMLVHGIGTVIGLNVKTEGPVVVYQGVTLGGNNKNREFNGRYFSQPWLKSNSKIYANATIIGPVIVGEKSVVGANAFLTNDVPDGITLFNKAENITLGGD